MEECAAIEFLLERLKVTKNNNDFFDAIKKVGGRAVDPSATADGTDGSGDGHPDFSKILSDAQIWDLVKFLKEGAFDVTELYSVTLTGTYPTGTKSFYSSNLAVVKNCCC